MTFLSWVDRFLSMLQKGGNILLTYDFIVLIVRYHISKLAICRAFPSKQMRWNRPIQRGIGGPSKRDNFPVAAASIGLTAMQKKIKKRRALSSIRFLYHMFNLCRSSGRDFGPVENDQKSSIYFDVSAQRKRGFWGVRVKVYKVSTESRACKYMKQVVNWA